MKTVKRITNVFLILIMFIMLIFNAFANVDISYVDQSNIYDSYTYDINNYGLAYTESFTFVNATPQVHEVTLYNNYPIYMTLENSANETQYPSIIINTDAETQLSFNISPYGKVYIAFSSEQYGDSFNYQIYNGSNLMTSKIDALQYDKNSKSLFAPIISGISELISINLMIWRVIYYLVLFIIVIGFIGGLFWISFKIHGYNEKLATKKNPISGNRGE